MEVYKCADGQWIQMLGLDPGRFDNIVCECLDLDPKAPRLTWTLRPPD